MPTNMESERNSKQTVGNQNACAESKTKRGKLITSVRFEFEDKCSGEEEQEGAEDEKEKNNRNH